MADFGVGGIWSNFGTAILVRSSVTSNRAPSVGAILLYGGSTTIKSSTIAENEGANRFGGIFTNGGLLVLKDSTIYRNSAYGCWNCEDTGAAGGLALLSNAVISNTVIAENFPKNCTSDLDEGLDIVWNFLSRGTSMASDTTCEVHPSFTRVSSQVMLGDREYSTSFFGIGYRPSPGSPLIDAGEACITYDQFRQIRPLDGDGDGIKECDIGAVEYNSSDYATYKESILNPPALDCIIGFNCNGTSPGEKL